MDLEFKQVMEYGHELWPKWIPGAAQGEAWKAKLKNYSINTVKQSLRDHYAESKQNQPNLGAVYGRCKTKQPVVYKTDLPAGYKVATDQDKLQILADEADAGNEFAAMMLERNLTNPVTALAESF